MAFSLGKAKLNQTKCCQFELTQLLSFFRTFNALCIIKSMSSAASSNFSLILITLFFRMICHCQQQSTRLILKYCSITAFSLLQSYNSFILFCFTEFFNTLYTDINENIFKQFLLTHFQCSKVDLSQQPAKLKPVCLFLQQLCFFSARPTGTTKHCFQGMSFVLQILASAKAGAFSYR